MVGCRGRIQGGGDINTALGLLPDKLKTELALHVNLSVLKKVGVDMSVQNMYHHSTRRARWEHESVSNADLTTDKLELKSRTSRKNYVPRYPRLNHYSYCWMWQDFGRISKIKNALFELMSFKNIDCEFFEVHDDLMFFVRFFTKSMCLDNGFLNNQILQKTWR